NLAADDLRIGGKSTMPELVAQDQYCGRARGPGLVVGERTPDRGRHAERGEERRGHELSVDALRNTIRFGAEITFVHQRGRERVENLDAVLPREVVGQ